MKYLFIVFIIIISLACSDENKNLELLKVTEYSSSKVSDSALVTVLGNNGIKVNIDYTQSADYVLKQLDNGNVDLVILPNNIGNIDFDFRFLAPLLPRVLMIFTNNKTDIKDLKELLENGIVFFENMSRLDSLFFDKLYYNYNVDKSKVNTQSLDELDLNIVSDSLLIYVGLTHLNNDFIKEMADLNWSIISIADVEYYGKGSNVEGFSLMNTSIYPFLIPKYIYKGEPKKPILTVAIKYINCQERS